MDFFKPFRRRKSTSGKSIENKELEKKIRRAYKNGVEDGIKSVQSLPQIIIFVENINGVKTMYSDI